MCQMPNPGLGAKRISILILALFMGFMACNAPLGLGVEATPTQLAPDIPFPSTPTLPELMTPEGSPASAAVSEVDFEGVHFSYADPLALEVQMETVPEQSGEDTPEWVRTPEYLHIRFIGYPLSDTFHEPQISVYPVAEYEALSPPAAAIISELRSLLMEKPSTPSEPIPFLPTFNAAQFMQAHVEYLDFENGSGVRFLTQYGQAAWPINNTDLFYTFQGLAEDDSSYVSVIMPVSNPILPPDGEQVPDGDYAAFADRFMEYVEDMEVQLNGQPGSSFMPDLSTLDAMIRSLSVVGGP